VKSVAVYVVVDSFGRFVQPDSVTEFTVAAGAHRKLWTGRRILELSYNFYLIIFLVM
jgi:hypothetical protein